MSNLHDHDGGEQHLTTAAPPHAAGLRQFANGSHASHSMAGPKATPEEALVDIDAQTPPNTDSLVMLQLASFAGRAL